MTFIVGLTDAQLRASAPNVNVTNASLAVTGTFYQTTQPVSGTVTVGNASLAVTGSFFQATQPVSIAATVAISAASLPLPAGAALDATLTGGTQKAIARGGAKGTTVAADVTSVAIDANTQALHTSVTNFPATQAVSIATMPSTPVTGTFWQATQPISGTVTINAIPTGANTIGNVGLVAGAAVIGAVTQSGTWNVGTITTLPALVAGSAIVGKFGIDQTTPGTTNLVSIGTNGTVAINAAIPTGANVIGALTANQTVNNAQIGGVAPLMGNGVTGTGSQRVTIASDNTAFSVIATQAVGTNSTTGDTGAKTATGNGATLTNAGNKGVQILLNMGAVSGTTPTFVMKVQGSADGGTTFYDIPGATTASLVATGVFGITIYPGVTTTAGTTTTGTTAAASQTLPRTWRVVWTIGGTTPSFTITAVQYNYLTN